MVTTSELIVSKTAIDGLLEVELPVHRDGRGWFKENYQAEKLTSAGLPPLEFVQHNLSFNERAGVLRGIHAEPWDKYVSLASGRATVAIVELRDGPDFGRVVTLELRPDRALLIPEGCGNSYQTLEDATCYTYLVTKHWSPTTPYVAVDPFDPTLAIAWPIGRGEAIVSEKDLANPPLSALIPLAPAPSRSQPDLDTAAG